MKRSLVSVLALCAAAAFGGCTASRLRPGDVLAERPTDFVPLGDRDHFVFLSERTVDGRTQEREVVVEHVTAAPSAAREFQITESRDGMRIGDSRWRVDEQGISLVSEDVDGLDVRLDYQPPLLLFPQPLLFGEHRAASSGVATRLADDAPVGTFEATASIQAAPGPRVHPLTGAARTVSFRIQRSLRAPSGTLTMLVDSTHAEGAGEVEATATLEGTAFVVRRSLRCAFIQGRAIGRCEAVDGDEPEAGMRRGSDR